MKNNITFSDLIELKQDLREKYTYRLNLAFRIKEWQRDTRNGKFSQTPARVDEKLKYLNDNLRFVNKQIKRLEDTLNTAKLI